MKNFFREDSRVPYAMCVAMGIIIGLVIGNFSAVTARIEGVESVTESSSELDRAAATAYLEQGVEIEGEDALNDVPPVDITSDTIIVDATSTTTEDPSCSHEEAYYFDSEYTPISWEDTGNGYSQVTEGADFVKAKLTTPLSDHVWRTAKTDLAQDADCNLVITKEQLNNATAGSVLAVKRLEDGDIYITVPEVRVDGTKTTQLDQYGVVQVFQIKGESDYFYADASLYLYDKTMLTDESPLIFYGDDCWCITSPLAYPPNVSYVSERFATLSSDPGIYTARASSYSQFGFGGGGPVSDGEVIKFSKNWVDFDADSFQEILDWIEELNIGGRASAASLWNSDKTSYDLLGLFDWETGKFADQLELTKVDSDLYYISASHLPTRMIILQPESISIAVSGSMCISLEEDKLWLGEYFKDTSGSSEMVKIEGTDLTLTRPTAEALISLLNENGVNWWAYGLSDLTLE